MGDTLGKEIEVFHTGEFVGDPDVTCADFTLINALTGWAAQVPVLEGVALTVKHLSQELA